MPAGSQAPAFLSCHRQWARPRGWLIYERAARSARDAVLASVHCADGARVGGLLRITDDDHHGARCLLLATAGSFDTIDSDEISETREKAPGYEQFAGEDAGSVTW